MDYQFRPTDCEHMSIVEFFSKTEKVKKNSKSTESNGEEEEVRTSKYLLRFQPNHPQYKTHAVRYRAASAITCFIGPTFPRRDLEVHNETYGKYVLLFFHPWREIAELKMAQQTWENRKQEWLSDPASPPWVHRMLNNIQSLHEGEDKRKQLREENKSSRLNIIEPSQLHRSEGPYDGAFENDEDVLEEGVCFFFP